MQGLGSMVERTMLARGHRMIIPAARYVCVWFRVSG